MLQDQNLRVQEDQNLTSALIAEGRGLLEAATAQADAAGKALAVSATSAQPPPPGLAKDPPPPKIQAPHSHMNRCSCIHKVHFSP